MLHFGFLGLRGDGCCFALADPQLVKLIFPSAYTVGPPYTLHFRIKYYSSEPNNLHEEFTR